MGTATTNNTSEFVMVVAVLIMLPVIAGFSVLLRLAMGRRLRKATTKELRWYSAFFAFLPIWMVLFANLGPGLGPSRFDRIGLVGLWFCAMAIILGVSMSLWGWAKFVPAKVSWWIGGVIWSITIGLAFTDRLR
jgi:hypothetical protein